MNEKPHYLLTIPEGEYHAASKRGEFLSSHNLGLFRHCPLAYRRAMDETEPKPDSPALAIGRAAHCLILEGKDAFDERYLVSAGPINPRTCTPYGKTTKAYLDWAKDQPKEIVAPEDYDLARRMLEGVLRSEEASRLLLSGYAESVCRAPYCGMPSQIRMDWFDEENGIVDLKTCDDLDRFEYAVRAFGYGHQMAFYRAVLRLVSGETQNEAAVGRLLECLRTDVWPTGYEAPRIITEV